MDLHIEFTLNGKKGSVDAKGLAYVETVKGFDYMSLENATLLAKTGELVAIHQYPREEVFS